MSPQDMRNQMDKLEKNQPVYYCMISVDRPLKDDFPALLCMIEKQAGFAPVKSKNPTGALVMGNNSFSTNDLKNIIENNLMNTTDIKGSAMIFDGTQAYDIHLEDGKYWNNLL